MTSEQEARLFKYPKVYLRWKEKADKMGYSTVTGMFQDLYDGGRSVYDIANLVGITQMGVWKMMKRLKITMRLPAVERPEMLYIDGKNKMGDL
ncbi:MAG: hypothetical protein ABID54_00410 [Pseudomonadota bacterium]